MIDEKYPYDILFIEDEKAIRDTYVKYLKMLFNNVYEAEDGEEAYEMYKLHRPHILIVDIHLPKLSGIDLLKRIRKTDQTTKAIVLTAHTDTDILVDATALKLTKYLIKPISRKELKDALTLVLNELLSFKTLSLKKIDLTDGYSWEFETQHLICNHKVIELTKKEKLLFTLLISDLNKLFTYDDILHEIWFNLNEGTLESVKTLIKNLRRKLPKDTIKNVFGVGYKIDLK